MTDLTYNPSLYHIRSPWSIFVRSLLSNSSLYRIPALGLLCGLPVHLVHAAWSWSRRIGHNCSHLTYEFFTNRALYAGFFKNDSCLVALFTLSAHVCAQTL